MTCQQLHELGNQSEFLQSVLRKLRAYMGHGPGSLKKMGLIRQFAYP